MFKKIQPHLISIGFITIGIILTNFSKGLFLKRNLEGLKISKNIIWECILRLSMENIPALAGIFCIILGFGIILYYKLQKKL